jgi:hypothetical protein
MSYNDKILKSLDTALNYYNNSAVALTNKDKKTLENHFWHVLSEIEYTLFILSLMFDKEQYERYLPKTKEMDKNNLSINKLLNEAKNSITNNNIFEAYKNIYMARYYTIKIYDIIRRKQNAKEENLS